MPQQLDRARRGASAPIRPWWRWIASAIWSPTVQAGLSEVIGSWKIMASAVAAQVAQSFGRRASGRSRPSKRTSPLTAEFSGGSRPMIGERGHALAAARFADQPQGAAARQREVDAVHGVDGAVVGGEGDGEAAQLEQRPGHRRLLRSAARRLSMPASITARSKMPTGFSRVGRKARKCVQRSRLTASRRVQLEQRLDMVVDAKIELGIFLVAVDDQRGAIACRACRRPPSRPPSWRAIRRRGRAATRFRGSSARSRR